MKRVVAVFLIFCALILTVPQTTSTASALTNYCSTNFEIALLDKNNELTLLSESINFSLLDEANSAIPDYMTSNYQIENKGGTTTARIGVPVFDSLSDNFSSTVLMANDVCVFPEIYYFNISSLNLVDFNDILENGFSEPCIYDDNQCGLLYTFNSDTDFTVTFSLNENQKIVTGGLWPANDLSSNKSEYTMFTYNTAAYYPYDTPVETPYIFVTSGTLEFEFSSENIIVTKKELSYNDFLIERDNPDNAKWAYIYRSRSFDRLITGNQTRTTFDSFFTLSRLNKYMVLVYEVEFVSGINTLSLSRPAKSFEWYKNDKTYYSFYMINQPLTTWASLENIEMNIKTNSYWAYIGDSYLTGKGNDNYYYSGDLSTREEYLINFAYYDFSLMNKPQVWNAPTITITVLLCVALLGFVFSSTLAIVTYLQERKKQANEIRKI